jgi:hypothetical protein
LASERVEGRGVRHRGVPVCSPYPGRRGGAPVVRLRLLSHRDQHACLAALSAIGLRPAHLAPRLLASGINFEERWHVRFDSRDLLPTAERFFRDIQPRGRAEMSMLQTHDSALQPMTPALRLEQFGEQLLAEAVPMSHRPGRPNLGATVVRR